jgi:hypothetical protein
MDAWVLFFLGMGGVLARTDFGLLPFSILIAAKINKNKSGIRSALMGMFGAIMGLIITFMHTYGYSGEILQSSVLMKFYWHEVLGGTLVGPMFLSLNTIGIYDDYISLGVLVIALISLIILRKEVRLRWNSLSEQERIVFTAANVCLLGYFLVYTQSRPLQPWYTANLYVPVFMLLYTIAVVLNSDLSSTTRRLTVLIFSTLCLIVILKNVINVYPTNSDQAPWPHQQSMYRAGVYLHQTNFNAKIGSWNAGIINYFQGGQVINLDGLMNDEVQPYIKTNQLPLYIDDENITYVVDYANMFSPLARIAGGYDDQDFLTRLNPIQVFDQGEYGWKYMTLYEINSK